MDEISISQSSEEQTILPFTPNSPEESDLEQLAFAAANGKDVPEPVRGVIRTLWKQYVLREQWFKLQTPIDTAANRVVYNLQLGGDRLCTALRKISDGCNDPVSVAKTALNHKAKWMEPPVGLTDNKIKLALRVLGIFNGFDGLDHDEVWWRVDGTYAPVTMLVNCNDLFYWACADAEEITSANIDDLEKVIQEVRDIDKSELSLALLLWVCRNRKMRPQLPYYDHIPSKFHDLFNQVGPERTFDNSDQSKVSVYSSNN